jgi:hypothetical protein
VLPRSSGDAAAYIGGKRRLGEVFARFGIESVATRYTIAGGKGIDVAEIIVTGPSPHEAMPPARDLLSLQSFEHSHAFALT